LPDVGLFDVDRGGLSEPEHLVELAGVPSRRVVDGHGQCGRRFWMRRPPTFAKIVLERGDEQASHVSSAGGLRAVAIDAPLPLDDLPSPAREWLAGHGIEW
jgi:hypothetical protein